MLEKYDCCTSKVDQQCKLQDYTILFEIEKYDCENIVHVNWYLKKKIFIYFLILIKGMSENKV